MRKLSSFVLLPDAYRPWKPFALRGARRIIRDGDIDLIYTTSSPDTAHLVGEDLFRETGLPWVADFRDPWTQRIAFDPPSALQRRWHLAHEARVLRTATRVVVTADETRDDFVDRYPDLTAAKFAVIPNGYDREDFSTELATPDWSRFRLVYTGQLAAKRTIAPLLPVLARFFDRVPDARRNTEVRFVGPREIENDRLVDDADLGDVIAFHPNRPHRQAIAELGEAHVILLLEYLGPRGGLIAQGKLYECLYAGRPVLALVPEGAVTRLMAELGGGCAACDPGSDDPVDFLIRAFRAWERRELLPGADRGSLAPYERRALARRLASLFDAAIS